jgi:hypothetical protein
VVVVVVVRSCAATKLAAARLKAMLPAMQSKRLLMLEFSSEF